MTGRPRRAVITGIGLVTALGSDVEQVWGKLREGTSGIDAISRFDARGYPSRIAGEASFFNPAAVTARWPAWTGRGRIGQFAAAAAADAIDDAGNPFSGTPERWGVVIAAGTGLFEHAEVFGACAGARESRTGDVDWARLCAGFRARLGPQALARRSPGAIANQVALDLGVRGPVMAVMTACAGGTQAIGDALRWIRSGRADVVLTGGADSDVNPMGLASFCLLGALSRGNDAPRTASRPFDAARDGFVLAEGAAMLIVEERERALARGARVYAEVAGFGSGCDAYRITDPHPNGDGAVLAMTRSLADAGCQSADVGYVNAHGTSTTANDRAETVALKRLFGPRAADVPVSSTKSMIGHALVAAGAIEAAVTALTLRDQILHPTINQATPDPLCDLDYVPNVARAAGVDVALSNSFAFGGQTACLALRRADS